jgi:hypothetical protein
MMVKDNDYVLSGSSSVNTDTKVYLKQKKSSTNYKSKYKHSTVKKCYRRKKRKHAFYGTLVEAQSMAKQSPRKVISSFRK